MLLAPEVYSVWDGPGTRRRRESQRPCRTSAEERVERERCVADARARAASRPTRLRSDKHKTVDGGVTYRAIADGANLDRTTLGDGVITSVGGSVRAGEGEREDGDSTEGTHGV